MNKRFFGLDLRNSIFQILTMRLVCILAIFLCSAGADTISSFLTDGENKTLTSLEV